MRELLPNDIVRRPRKPFRAPMAAALSGSWCADYLERTLSREAVSSAGYLDPQAVSRLFAKAGSSNPLAEGEEMALAGAISVQLLHEQSVDGRPALDADWPHGVAVFRTYRSELVEWIAA